MANFLQYEVRVVDGKQYIYDEKGKQLNRIPYGMDKRIYFTIWGVFSYVEIDDNLYPKLFSSIRMNGELLWDRVSEAEEFQENGHVGWKTREGELMMPPVFDQIEVCESYIYARYHNRELEVYRNGSMSEGCCLEDGTFHQNGKIGMRNADGTLLFEPKYDELYRWNDDSDVFYTRIGDEFHYFNSKKEEILTSYRRFEGVDDHRCPYYISEEQREPILITMQMTDDLSDPQSCHCFGHNVRLDRILKSEVGDIVKSGQLIWDKGVDALRSFYHVDTYIYSAYYARSKSPTPVEDCLSQFSDMLCYDTSWNFLLKIWVKAPSSLSTVELNKAINHFQDLNHSLPMNFFTIACDETLEEGEVKMFQVNYFTDRFPDELDELYYSLTDGSVEEYLEKKESLLCKMKERRNKGKWSDEAYNCRYDDYFRGNAIGPLCRPYHNYKKQKYLYEYLVIQEGWLVESLVIKQCQKLNMTCKFSESVEDVRCAYQFIKWGLKKGSSVNLTLEGHSSLDFIKEAIEYVESKIDKGFKSKLVLYRKIYRLLEKHGARTAVEIRAMNIYPWGILT